jgi:DNA-binding PadR family transcriptional regulator
MAASGLERVLLGLLAGGPRSGYDLRKQLTQSPLRRFSDSPGAIYPALRRLKARRWVEVRATGGGRGRQEFRLNEGGRRALVAWLKQPVTRDEIVLRPGDVLLRCAFMDGVLPRSAIVRLLADYEAEMAAYIDVLREYEAEHAASIPLVPRLIVQHGRMGYEAEVLWARQARAALGRAGTAAKKGRRRT